MKKASFFALAALPATLLLSQCQQAKTEATEPLAKSEQLFGGFATQEELGEHLVTIAGCHDCHTPKKMGPNGPELDLENALSGHPSALPIPDLDRADLEAKGAAASQTMTAWIGPWGVSFSSNISSDATGIGNWTEGQFFTALRQGKSKGIATNRQILPPMPYQMFSQMTDEEIRAIFAYLKSTKPVDNVVPQPLPPLSAQAQ